MSALADAAREYREAQRAYRAADAAAQKAYTIARRRAGDVFEIMGDRRLHTYEIDGMTFDATHGTIQYGTQS